jgi:hypothetical protein
MFYFISFINPPLNGAVGALITLGAKRPLPEAVNSHQPIPPPHTSAIPSAKQKTAQFLPFMFYFISFINPPLNGAVGEAKDSAI